MTELETLEAIREQLVTLNGFAGDLKHLLLYLIGVVFLIVAMTQPRP